MMRRPDILTFFVVVVCTYKFDLEIYVNQGESVLLPCKNETPPGRFYGMVWKSRVELYNYMPRSGLKIHKKIAGRFKLVNETSFQIFNVTLDDAGAYECNLLYFPVDLTFNTHIPWVVMPAFLNLIVIGRPHITSLNPATQYPANDGKAVLKCEFLGKPYANVSWNFERRRDLTDKSTRVNNTSILTLRRLKKRDTGFYYCVAYSSAGKAEKKAYVKVKYRPRMRILTPNPHINLGKTGTITCRAKGFPVPTMSWYFQTAEREFSLGPLDRYEDKFFISLTRVGYAEDWAESVLTIKPLEVHDWESNYTCVASNSQGSIDKVVRVNGFGMPERPDLRVLEETTHSALLRWSVPKDGGSRILAYVVQFRNTSEIRWMSRELRPANIRSYFIMELHPNSTYVCRIAARNEVGLGAFSFPVYFTTVAEKALRVQRRTRAPSKPGLQPTKNRSGTSEQEIVKAITILSGCALLAIAVLLGFCYLVGKPQKLTNSHPTAVLISTSANGSLPQQEGRQPSEMASQSESMPLIESVDHWEFPRARLRLTTVIGDGAFGTVMRGVARGIRSSCENEIVAVKIVRDSDSEIARKDLNSELDMLKLLPEHPNVVSFLGCCTRNEPPLIIVEYCVYGDLQGFLRNSRGISESYYKSNFKQFEHKMTSKMLLNVALQVSTGMGYLAAFKIIHRDLAARNILVGEDLVCKISDFGLARDVYVEDQYVRKSQGGRFPVKWMALESINFGISTQKSDVWSFGVLLWEIITLGASPYPGLNSHELVNFLQDGYRMEKPKHCSSELFALSISCWQSAPKRRPDFQELAEMLEDMIDKDKEYIDMNAYQHHVYENVDSTP